MGHLKKDATTGHLLKTTGGHLVNECAAVGCPDCDANCGVALDITFTGFTGIYAVLNDTFTMPYEQSCLWGDTLLATIGACEALLGFFGCGTLVADKWSFYLDISGFGCAPNDGYASGDPTNNVTCAGGEISGSGTWTGYGALAGMTGTWSVATA
jgi:hypothetical protein